jgi:acetolactate synthase-1/2/3 large subunit
MEFSHSPQQWGGWGIEVREASKIAPALKQAREMVAKPGKSAVVNVWVDPNEYAPGTENQTMYQ